jgi:hypothetical protein
LDPETDCFLLGRAVASTGLGPGSGRDITIYPLSWHEEHEKLWKKKRKKEERLNAKGRKTR